MGNLHRFFPRALLLALTVSLGPACSGDEPDRVPDDEPEPDPPGVSVDAGTQAPDRGSTAAPDAFVVETPDSGTPVDPPDSGSHADHDTGVSPSPDAGTRDGGAFADAAAPRDGGVRPDAQMGPAVLNPGWIGGPCQGDGDCMYTGGFCLRDSSGWPGGTCSQSCSRTCPDRTGPLNSVTFCIDDGNGDANGSCVSRCDFTISPTGCRAGYVCMPEKRWSESTTVRQVCVPLAGVPGRAPPAFDIGASCTTDSQCNRNVCLTGLPGGYCTQKSCNIVGCPTGSRCWNIGGTENYFACLRDCTGANDCRTQESYACDADRTCWPTPPPPPVCDLSGGPSDCSPYAAMATPDFVVVTKHSRRLTLCRGATRVNSWCVGLGSSPVLDKEREGDRRTPEGVFYIPRRIPNSEYYKAFLISYPDDADAARGLAAGLITRAEHDAIVAAQAARTEPPQNTALGGLIEIHGNGAGSDWTWGCVAVEDSTIDSLWPVLDVGETVVILH